MPECNPKTSSSLNEARRYFDVEELAFVKMLGGYSSSNSLVIADGVPHVLKIRGKESKSRIADEEQNASVLLNNKITCPLPRKTISGESYFTLGDDLLQLIPFIPGTPLHRPTLNITSLRSVAQSLRLIHSLSGSGASAASDESIHDLLCEAETTGHESVIELLKIKEKLLLLPKVEERITLVHGDFHGENILVNDNHLVCGVLDLENMGMGGAYYDIFSFVSISCCTMEFSRENCLFAAPFLQEYFGEGKHLAKKVISSFQSYLRRWACGYFLEREALRGNRVVLPLIERDVKKFGIFDDGVAQTAELFVEGMGRS